MGSAIFTVFIVACLYPTVLFSRRQFPERLSHITVSQDLRIDMLVPASERGGEEAGGCFVVDLDFCKVV